MAKGHFWLAEPMKEVGTEMNEPTMEKLVTAAWKETEKELKKKLDEAYSSNGKYLHQWIRQDYQTPIATMKKADGSITMNFQEIHHTLVEAWRPIFVRWDGKEEPRYSDFEERCG